MDPCKDFVKAILFLTYDLVFVVCMYLYFFVFFLVHNSFLGNNIFYSLEY